jgi:hypothetical protein
MAPGINNKNYGSGGKGGDFGPYTTEAGTRIGLEAAAQSANKALQSSAGIGGAAAFPASAAASQTSAVATPITPQATQASVAPQPKADMARTAIYRGGQFPEIQQPATASQAGGQSGTDPIEAGLRDQAQASMYKPWESGFTMGGQTIEERQTAALQQLQGYQNTQSRIGLNTASAGHLGAESENIRNPGAALTSSLDAMGKATSHQVQNAQALRGLPDSPVGESPLEAGQPYDPARKEAYLARPENKEFAAHLQTFDPANPLPFFQRAQTFPGAMTPGHPYNDIINNVYDKAYATNPIERQKQTGNYWTLGQSLRGGSSALTGQPSVDQQLASLLSQAGIGSTPRYAQQQTPLPQIAVQQRQHRRP